MVRDGETPNSPERLQEDGNFQPNGPSNGWNVANETGRLRRKYEGESDDDIMLIESARRNVMRAKYLLAKEGKLSREEMNKLSLYMMTPMAEATVELGMMLAPYSRGAQLSKPLAMGPRVGGTVTNPTRIGEVAEQFAMDGYDIAGSRILQGNNYKVNIWGLYAQKTPEGVSKVAGLNTLFNSFETQAARAGANRVTITGSHVVNEQIMNPRIMQRIARRGGYNMRTVDERIIFTKSLNALQKAK